MTGAREPRWAVVMAIGPGTTEVDRGADTLGSLAHFEPDVTRVVLVDDESAAGRDLVGMAGPLGDRTVVLPNRRDPSLQGWNDGLAVGLAQAYEHLVSADEVDWLVKLDTDSLVIAPFARQVDERFASDDRIGMIGAYDRTTTGEVRDFRPQASHMRKLSAILSVWRPPHPLVRHGLAGRQARRREVIRRARAQGYEYSEHCQGGGYALRVAALAEISRQGWLSADLFAGTMSAEDMVFSVMVVAAGYRLNGMVQPGEPFAVRHEGLEAEPMELLESGYAIIHSIKSHDGWTEDQLRELFGGIRQAT